MLRHGTDIDVPYRHPATHTLLLTIPLLVHFLVLIARGAGSPIPR